MSKVVYDYSQYLSRDQAAVLILERIKIPENVNDCWIPSLSPSSNGYIEFKKTMTKRGYLSALGHRLSYYAFVGDPTEYSVCHRCDNPPCLNPYHLFLGTHKMNMEDMRRKERARGMQFAPSNKG